MEAAQVELSEAHHRFDDAEHRFRRVLAQGMGLPAFGGRQPMHHRLHGGRLRRSRRVLGETVFPEQVMALASQGD